MLKFAINLNEPVVIRYPRGGEGDYKFEKHEPIEKGKAEISEEGKDITIVAIGKMVDRAMKVSEILKEKNIEAEVINVRFLKPIDEKTIVSSISKTKNVITIEDNSVEGGLGTVVSELIVKNNLQNIKMKKLGYPDEFVKHASTGEIEKLYGLDAEAIAKSCI